MALPGKRFTAYGSAILLVLATLTVTTAATAAAAPGPKELCGPGSEIDFDPWEFPASPRVDNKWFPLKPGMQFTTDGTVTSAEGTSAHKVVHTVTGLTKVIDGVNTLVMWDRDYSDGELANPSWRSSPSRRMARSGSSASIRRSTRTANLWVRPAPLSVGSPRRRPESRCTAVRGPARRRTCRHMPPKSTSSTAGRSSRSARTSASPTGCYDDVLVIDEYNPLDPPSAGHQRKFYSAGTGLVRVTAVGGAEQETIGVWSRSGSSAIRSSGRSMNRPWNWTTAPTRSARTYMPRRPAPSR